MWNIMKAQLYQIKRSRLILAVFFMLLFVQFTTAMGEINYQEGNLTGGKYLASNGVYICLLAMMFGFVLVGEICGADLKDKTGGYELMAGHTRREVYLSRAILSLIIGTISVSLLVAFSVAIVSMKCGWGEELELTKVLLRGVLLLLPIQRLICEFIFLTFLLKNPYVSMAGGYFVFLGGQIISQNAANGNSMFHAVTNINALLKFDIWETYSLINGRSIQVYSASLEPSTILGTMLASFVFGMLFLGMGYIFFKNDDLN